MPAPYDVHRTEDAIAEVDEVFRLYPLRRAAIITALGELYSFLRETPYKGGRHRRDEDRFQTDSTNTLSVWYYVDEGPPSEVTVMHVLIMDG